MKATKKAIKIEDFLTVNKSKCVFCNNIDSVLKEYEGIILREFTVKNYFISGMYQKYQNEILKKKGEMK